MKKHLAAFLIALALGPPAYAQTINNLGAGRGSVVGTDLFPSYQGANPAVRPAASQIAAYVYSLLSADATASGTGALTLATVNANVGTFGSATSCITTTQNAKGLTTAISAATCTPAIGSITGLGTGVATFLATPSSANLAAALTDETGTGVAVFGTAPTISSPTINTAATLAFLTGSTQCLQVNTSGVISGTGAVCGGAGSTGANPTATAGPTAVNGVATTFLRSDGAPAVQLGTAAQKGIVQVDGTTITATAGVISTAPITVSTRVETGTNPSLPSSDQTKTVYLNNAANQVPTIGQATGSFGTGWFATYCNIGAGTQTITPSTSTIGGLSTLLIPAGSAARPQCYTIISDGTNYLLVPNSGTIFTGTATLGTSAIGSAACATVVTVSAPGVATTDVVLAGFNGDPTAVTGYVPLTAGMLTIIGYPTANNTNFKVCNNTTASITPGAITLNVKVVR